MEVKLEFSYAPYFRYDCNIILLYCVTSVAIYLAVIPVCHVFGIMLAFFSLLGVHMGVIDTVANSVLIKIHGKKVGHGTFLLSTNRQQTTNMLPYQLPILLVPCGT